MHQAESRSEVLVFGQRRRYPGWVIALAAAVMLVLSASGVAVLATGGWPIALSAFVLAAIVPLVLGGFRRPSRYLLVNREGLDDHIAGVGHVPWSQLVDLEVTEREGDAAVLATINDPDGDFARLPTFWRVDGSSNSLIPPKEPIGQVFWPRELLRVDPIQVVTRIREYRLDAGFGFGTGN
jgi:hypothetical protein